MAGLSPAVPTHALQRALSGPAETLQKRLAALDPQADGDRQELREQLADFASLLIFQMLQAMRRTVPQSGLLHTGFAHDLYVSLFDREVARQISRGESMGLSALLQRQFDASPGASPTPRHTHRALEAYQQQLPQDRGRFTMPADGPLSSSFGWRPDPFNHVETWHNGVDLAAPAGSWVRAAAPGHVTFSGTQDGYGNLLIVDHEDGYQTYYAHNAENLVPAGTQVRRGQPIARVGQSGRASGPHIHFEVRQHGRALDPTPLLNRELTAAK